MINRPNEREEKISTCGAENLKTFLLLLLCLFFTFFGPTENVSKAPKKRQKERKKEKAFIMS